MVNINTYLKEKQALIDTALKDHLPHEGTRPAILHEAMRYTVLAGGKRIRPALCLATAEALGTDAVNVLKPAIAIELLHSSTLIHDDLPCMDDDDLRRGNQTCHVKYGAANAILTGDALMILSFQVLAENGDPRLALELSQAAGSQGVIGGQVEDLAAEGSEPSADLIDFIHRNKTAVLIRAAVRIGALAAGANKAELVNFSVFGENIGLAFQIVDDVLDETSTDEVLGKPTGSDRDANKMTYPAVYGMEKAKETVRDLTNDALIALDSINADTEVLKAIALYLVNREN
ncbi:MAG: polyprenyl synthetase family protein [Kiritimatiellales bacterium]|nr:polyprenyl synthetase family protein [Kiritimatiellales bacterium]